MKSNEKGVALIVTLVLGFAALAFIAGLFYMLNTGTEVSGTEKRYYTALAAAKGTSEFVMNELVLGNTLTCNGGNSCTPCPTGENSSCKLDLNLNLGDYDVNAYLLSKETSGTATIYTIKVKAVNQNKPNEKAVVEFVYKVE